MSNALLLLFLQLCIQLPLVILLERLALLHLMATVDQLRSRLLQLRFGR